MIVKYIVWHTAADRRDNGERDTSVAEIRAWHRANGWSDIGYHYVIRRDGRVEVGRPENHPGAHTKGLNTCSIGICFSGHGDLQPLTPQQVVAGQELTIRLMKKYGVPVWRVIGHREVNDLVVARLLDSKYRTTKTCPGQKVDMAAIRKSIQRRLHFAEKNAEGKRDQ